MGRRPRVYVVERKDSPNYALRWQDPKTGKWRQRSAKTSRKREAYKAAAALERTLETGGSDPDVISWDDFKLRYSAEKASTLADNTRKLWATAANHFESIIRPVMLAEVSTQALSRFAARLRATEIEETSISAYLRQLRAAFNWAARMGYLETAPKIELTRANKRSNKGEMKGRPLVLEEFERMLVKTIDRVADENAASWRELLRGLWLSGLRLGEALDFHWTDETRISIDGIDKRRPMFRIPAGGDKSGKATLTPMAPEFVEFLRAMESREGFVFNALVREGRPTRVLKTASQTISDIGRLANVVVSREGKGKFASAHDLRRSFGARWAVRVMPAVLQKMMRHSSVETTLRYYVGQNAELSAEAMWTAFFNSSCDSSDSGDETEESTPDVS